MKKKPNRSGWSVAFSIRGHEFVSKGLTRSEANRLMTDVCDCFMLEEGLSLVAVSVRHPSLKKQAYVIPRDRR